jgi:2',3'-cyclic-nucleotide 2'-phosphodiesterase (5'-nucleotidase family)
MRSACAQTQLRRISLLLFLLLTCASGVLAQTKPIEPCEPAVAPTPATAKCPDGSSKTSTQASKTLIDSSVPADPEVEKLIAPYAGKVRELSVVIGRLEGELKRGIVGAGPMGNFVTDGMKSQATKKNRSIVVAISNAGGMRKDSISPGQLLASDVFELLPFENVLITLDLSGAQLLKLLENVTRARDAQAGAHIQFRWNAQDRPEFISAKLIDASGQEREIDPQQTYTIVTIDYLYKLGSGNYALLQDGKNMTPLNLTLRDSVMDYVKSETAAGRPIRAEPDKRFIQVGPGPSRPVEVP